jgi:hypothetical protein
VIKATGSWGHLQTIMDAAFARHPGRAAIVAMPDGTPVAQWFDRFGGRVLNQQYVLHWAAPRGIGYAYVRRDHIGRVGG